MTGGSRGKGSDLTAPERVLVHLHASLGKDVGAEATQAGISDGARVQRSHVPRALKILLEESLVEPREVRLRGRTRRTTAYSLTPAGVQRARELLAIIDATPVDVDGERTNLGEARRTLGLSPLEALGSVGADGRLGGHPPPADATNLLERGDEIAFLRRWRAGGAPVAVVYGSKGMGKTSLGRAFARTIEGSAWIDLEGLTGLEDFSARVAEATRRSGGIPRGATDMPDAIVAAFDGGTRLLVVDGYGVVPEPVVDALSGVIARAAGHRGIKVLILAQETTPAYCRFYGRKDVIAGLVAERHLKGLDLEGCREMLANPSIREEDLRRIYLLTKGCPLYLQFIREGDEYGLKANSRFTKAEVQLLLYSGRGSA